MLNIYSRVRNAFPPKGFSVLLTVFLIFCFNTLRAEIEGASAACPGSVQSYWTMQSADNYDWYVYGGTIIEDYGSYIRVQWYSESVGYVELYSDKYDRYNYEYLEVTLTGVGAGQAKVSAPNICAGGGTLVSLEGYNGTILDWEQYQNGYWQPLGHTTQSFYASGLTQNTSFRARVNTSCGEGYSSAASVTVQQPTVAGTTSGPRWVVRGYESGIIHLSGHTGTVQHWQASTDGVNWYNIGGGGSNSYAFEPLQETTYYRAAVKNGICDYAYSQPARVEVIPVIYKAADACLYKENIYSSNLELQQYNWSVKGGYIISGLDTRTIKVIWYDDDNLKEVTLWGFTPGNEIPYEVTYSQQGAVAPDRDVYEVTTVTLNRAGGGRLTATHYDVCYGGYTNLSFTGYTGQIGRWERSFDGLNWETVAGQTNAVWQYGSIQRATWFRVVLDGGSCGDIVSNTIAIRKWDRVQKGYISGSTHVQAGNNAGNITLSSYRGVIQKWEKSDDGGETWTSIGQGGSATIAYTNLAATTLYRAYLSGGPCGGNTYSDIATIWVNRQLNFVHTRSYDENGGLTGEGRSYTDGLGKPVQNLTRALSAGSVLASQPLYDRNGNAVGQTLAAPVGAAFDYKQDFVTSAGTPYNHTHFDAEKTNSPDKADIDRASSLGWYYSENNTLEPYTATTHYPYSISATDPVGGSQRSAMPGDYHRMGYSREAAGKSMPVTTELDHYLELRGYFVGNSSTPATLRLKAVKQVSVDPNGRETVTFVDTDGKVLASCLVHETYPAMQVSANIAAGSELSFLDVHIPTSNSWGSGTLSMSGNGSVRLYSLKTGGIVYEGAPVSKTLTKGFYRVQSLAGTQSIAHDARYGEFTYNYYDDAGRLVATIAPEGVALGSTAQPTAFVTTYKYNSLGQLLRTTSPDEGTSNFVYRRDGKVRFSQNAKQAVQRRFSYTNYDRAGRVTEAGEYAMSTDPSQGIVFEDHLTLMPRSNSVLQESVLESTEPGGGLDAGRRSQQTYYVYDEPDENASAVLGGRKQEFTIGALARSYNAYSSTWYSYDEEGRTVWKVQKLQLGVKTIDYEYNEAGNLAKVSYQKGKTDEFVHVYTYDDDGRLKEVYTNQAGKTPMLQASYSYYLHGPLKRTSLGGGLQGLDYTYTVQGWLKGINHYAEGMDPGGDGGSDPLQKDLFGMVLQYYPSDFNSRALKNWGIEASATSSFYNGTPTISAWRSSRQAAPQAYAYTYDHKYQLLNARFGNLAKNTSYSYSFTATGTLGEQVSGYDAHGNIGKLLRTDGQGANLANYEYTYLPNSNKLQSVTNNAAGFLSYGYDQIGQVISKTEAGKGKYLNYDARGKVTLMTATGQLRIYYMYNEHGHQVRKEVLDYSQGMEPDNWFYVPDAAGNLQALYHRAATEPETGEVAKLDQVPVYGAGRIGMLARRSDGGGFEYLYEIPDHLGNVRAVFRSPEMGGLQATMEEGVAYEEERHFDHLGETRQLNAAYARTGRGSARLHAGSGRRYGPMRTLQVQPGDSVSISAWFSYRPQGREGGGVTVVPYVAPQDGPAVEQTVLQRVLGKLQLGFALIPKAKKAGGNEGMPVAHVQYAFYDRDSVYISGGAMPVTRQAGDNWEQVQAGAVAPEGAALAVLWAEQDGGQAVYVDDVTVAQVSDMLVQERHYYPFGQELLSLGYTNGAHYGYRYRYQGQYAEHDEATGWDSFELRAYDSQTGRWMAPDPYNEFYSPYVGMGNNPVNLTDPDGGCTSCFWDKVSQSFVYTFEVTVTPNSAWISSFMQAGYAAGAIAINFSRGFGNGFAAGGRDTYSYLRGLGTSEGWKATGRGLVESGQLLNTTSVESMMLRARLGSTVAGIPGMSAYELGYGVGYGAEKLGEAALTRRVAMGVSNVTKGMGVQFSSKIGRSPTGQRVLKFQARFPEANLNIRLDRGFRAPFKNTTSNYLGKPYNGFNTHINIQKPGAFNYHLPLNPLKWKYYNIP